MHLNKIIQISFKYKAKLVNKCEKGGLHGASWGASSSWGALPNFKFFNINPQFIQRNRKVHLTNCLETNFHDISIISLRVIRRKNYS